VSECWALEKKKSKADLVLKRARIVESENGDNPLSVENNDEYGLFLFEGLVSLVGEECNVKPIRVLRDTGASQSLLLEGVLALSQSAYTTGSNILLQGVGSEVISVLLHIVYLRVCGSVMVGVTPTPPVPGISFLLGNDLAGGLVPQNSVLVAEHAKPKCSLSHENSSGEQEIRDVREKKAVGNQIFMARLPTYLCNKDLEGIFCHYGKLTHCEVIQGTRLAYGFVKFEDRKDAEDAIHFENGRKVMGRRIVVEWSIRHKDRKSGRGYD